MLNSMRLSQFLFLIFSAICFSATADEVDKSKANSAENPLQLATVYHESIAVQDYWISEKLDGIRARWDGRHLFTRNGNLINAPAWFVQGFPPVMLDGELWVARGSFELTSSIVLRDEPSDDWRQVKMMVFDLPQHSGSFSQRLSAMLNLVSEVDSRYLQIIAQFRVENKQQLMAKLDELVAQGAEGLMLHHQDALYHDGRSSQLLKLKTYEDAEARVIAHLPGKGKYLNQMGAVLVEMDDGLQFKIGSGFSDLQRRNPPPIGSLITFKYFGLTAKGIPRFASFIRIRPEPITEQ